MSFCSSPLSQRSSICRSSSPEYLSPNTAVTTPSSSGGNSPKIESHTLTQAPSSPSERAYNYPQFSSPVETACTYAQTPAPAQDGFYNQPQSPCIHVQPPSPNVNTCQTYTHPSSSNSGPSPATNTPRYSSPGYPPASSFYGPLPTTSNPASSSPRQQRRKTPRRPDPETYRPQQWYTADGRKVEYSSMHLQCATM